MRKLLLRIPYLVICIMRTIIRNLLLLYIILIKDASDVKDTTREFLLRKFLH